MPIQGFRTTDNFVADQRPLHWRAALLLNYPNGDAPLFALTSALRSEAVDDPEFNWWEKPLQARRFALGADLDSSTGSATITLVAGGKTLKTGDLLFVEQSTEILRVMQNPTSDTAVVVQREYGTTVATAVTYNGASVNPNLLLIGSAYEEGSAAPDGRAYDPNKKYNYTQIFRNTFEHTRTAMKTRLRTPDDVKEAKRECLELHSRDIEMAFFLGNRTETTVNGKPCRTTGGIYESIASGNRLAVPNNQLTMNQLEQYMERFFAYGSSEKLAFVGNRAMTAINQTVRKNSAYQIFANEKIYGVKVTRIVSPHGELILKRHPLFNTVPGSAPGAGQTYFGLNSTMVVLDQKEIVYRYFRGDDTRYEPKLADTGIDGEKSGFLSEVGLEVHHGDTNHFWVTGLNAGIADV
jgi:hypothetical protein